MYACDIIEKHQEILDKLPEDLPCLDRFSYNRIPPHTQTWYEIAFMASKVQAHYLLLNGLQGLRSVFGGTKMGSVYSGHIDY